MTQQTAQAHRINIVAGQQSVFEALPTAEGMEPLVHPPR